MSAGVVKVSLQGKYSVRHSLVVAGDHITREVLDLSAEGAALNSHGRKAVDWKRK